MKKLLLSLLAVALLPISANAASDVFTGSDLSYFTNAYTVGSYTSTTTNVKYAAMCYSSNGMQINTSASSSATSSAILSVENPSNLIIESVVVTTYADASSKLKALRVSNEPGTVPADGTSGSKGVTIVTSPTSYTEVTATVSSDGKEFTFEPDGDYEYFYISSSAAVQITQVTVTYKEDSDKEAAGLSFSETAFTVTLGDEFTAPELSNPNGLEVTYSSSNEDVATVDADGNVEVVGTGVAKITATSEETDDYLAGSASYTLTVNGVAANIAEFLAAANTASQTTITGEVTVTYQSGNYLFVQDETGYLEVYGSVGKTYTNGTKLTGIAGTYAEYASMPELIPDASTFGDGEEGEAVAPAEVSADDIEVSQYVKLTDVEVTQSGSYYYADGVQLYNRFSLAVEFQEAPKATIVGLGSIYNSTRQIFVTEIEYTELPAVELGEVTLNGQAVADDDSYQFVEGTELTIACENAEEIYVYILDGSAEEVVNELVEGDSYTWTLSGIDEYTVEVIVSGCDAEIEHSFTIVITEAPEVSTSTLTVASFGEATGSTYDDYTATVDGITYAGCIFVPESDDYFSIRTSGSTGYGGIAVTVNDDKVCTGVAVTQSTLQTTTSSRIAYVYGSYEPFETGKGITVSTVPDGAVKLGQATMVKGSAVSIEFDEDAPYYPYILILANNTLQIESIDIEWAKRYEAPNVDFEHSGKLSDGGKVVFTLGHNKADLARIYYMHETSGAAEVKARRAASLTGSDWTELLDSNTVDISEVGTFHAYASDATGKNRSTVVSLSVGNETTTGIVEVGVAAEGAVEVYDLQGRKVSAPARGGLYIFKEGSKVSKRVL